jgi:hypothetical protein
MIRILLASAVVSACASLPLGGTSPAREACYLQAESAAWAKAELASEAACPGVAFLECPARDSILATLDADIQRGQEACQ